MIPHDIGIQVALDGDIAALWGVRTAVLDSSLRAVWVAFDPAPEGLCIPWLAERGLPGCTNVRDGMCFFPRASITAIESAIRRNDLADFTFRASNLATVRAQLSVWAAFRLIAGAPIYTLESLCAYDAGLRAARAEHAGELERSAQRARAEGTAWAASELGRLVGEVDALRGTVGRQRSELAARPAPVDGYARAARQREADAAEADRLAAAHREGIPNAMSSERALCLNAAAAALTALAVELREREVQS